MSKYIARVGVTDAAASPQPLEKHLFNVAMTCGGYLRSYGLEKTGILLGLIHDIGKYSDGFQNYIQSLGGLKKEGDSGFLRDAEKYRGKIPHAEAGAWYLESLDAIFEHCPDLKILLEMPVVYHHSYLEDIYAPDGEAPFLNKKKEGFKYFDALHDIFGRIDPGIQNLVREIVADKSFASEVKSFYDGLSSFAIKMPTSTCEEMQLKQNVIAYGRAILTRLLYSALIDADRIDAAGRSSNDFDEWDSLAKKMERRLSEFSSDGKIDKIRAKISQKALEASTSPDYPPGVYRFTIPTGGGKTFAALRFALHHAARHKMKHIIYAAPFLSILEQNAEAIRRIIDDVAGEYVLECHSNVLRDRDDEAPSSQISENWDAPIIATSMVQILNAMFSGESRYARRFHQLGDSVIILDEIQCLPLEMTYIFNCMVNFIAERMHSTIILCSATQPAFEKTSCPININGEIYPDKETLFTELKRVETEYVHTKNPDGSDSQFETKDSVLNFVSSRIDEISHSLLVICNTKPHAAELFSKLKEAHGDCLVFHLSTNLCAAHRKDVLKDIRASLADSSRKVVVVSTSLIEAGVDISFECVVRMMTSLDSIAQSAGRCNRNAESAMGHVYVLDNPRGIRLTPSVEAWSVSSKSALLRYNRMKEKYDNDPLSPALLNFYYAELYSANKERLPYPLGGMGGNLPKEETLFDLLGFNQKSLAAFRRLRGTAGISTKIHSAYKTAGRFFRALDDLTSSSVIVPYGDGKRIIAQILQIDSSRNPGVFNKLIRDAQIYTVNVTENVERKLKDTKAVFSISEEYGILAARESDYSEELGLAVGQGHLETLNF